MARRTLEDLQDVPVGLVYIAGTLHEAQAVERCMLDMGIDYAVSLEPYRTTSVLSGVYMGAFIYVPVVAHQVCRDRLEAQGLTDTVAMERKTPETPNGT